MFSSLDRLDAILAESSRHRIRTPKQETRYSLYTYCKSIEIVLKLQACLQLQNELGLGSIDTPEFVAIPSC